MKGALAGALLAAAVASGASRIARAQTAGAETLAADKLFRSGRAAFNRGDFVTACKDFTDSLRLERAAGTALNLSECEENLGRLVSARQHLRDALELLRADDVRTAIARERLARVERRVPRLTVRLADGAPPDTSVERDGATVDGSRLGVPEAVDPGEHRLVVRAPGHEDATLVVKLVDGEARALNVAPGGTPNAGPPPIVPAAAPREPAPALEASTHAGAGAQVLGLLSGGLGVLALGAGAYFGLSASSNLDASRRDHCGAAIGQSDRNRCDAEGFALRESAKTEADVSTALFVGGGTALAAGAILVLAPLLARKGGTASAVPIRPGFGPGGVSLAGAF